MHLKRRMDFNKMLPFQLKMLNLLPQLCEDPLLTGHSKETNKQTKTDLPILPCIEKSASECRFVQQWPHQVAFKADKVDPHWDGSVGVATQSFNPLHQVSAELVASLQDAQHHDVTVPQIIHDVSGQTFCPEHTRHVAHVQLQGGYLSCLWGADPTWADRLEDSLAYRLTWLLEPLPAVLGGVQGYTLDKSPVHCRVTWKDNFPQPHSKAHQWTI